MPTKKAAKKTAKRSTKKAAHAKPKSNTSKKKTTHTTSVSQKKQHASHNVEKKQHTTPNGKNDRKFAGVVIAAFAIIILAVILLSINQWGAVQNQVNDDARTVAYVNDYSISAQDLEEIGISIKQLDPTVSDDIILNQTAMVILLRNLAANEGIVADDVEVQARIDERMVYLTSVYSEEQFTQVLTDANLTREQFEEAQRKAIQDDIVIGELLNRKVYAQVANVSEAEALAYYRDNQQLFSQPEQRVVRHILICYEGTLQCDDGMLKADALREIEDVKRLLDEDVTRFADLAIEYSTGPSGPQGGLLGPATQGMFVQAFDEVAFSAPVGQVSDVVETEFGFHLILIDDIIPAQIVSFEEVQENIQQQLYSQRLQSAQQQYVTELMNNAEIRRVE